MNKKNYVGIIILILVIFVPIVLYAILSISDHNAYIIFPNDEVYYLKNNILKKVNYDIKKPLGITFISDEEKKLTFTYKNNMLIFYENKEPIMTPSESYVAYSSNKNIKTRDYKLKDINSKNLPKFSDILKNHDIIGYDYLTISKKLSFDFDSDGNDEEIYFVSNLFEELKYDKVFSFVYYIKDDKVIYLQDNVTESENSYDICVSDINSIIDINGNKIMNITCEYFSDIGVENNIYNYKKDKFNKINQ